VIAHADEPPDIVRRDAIRVAVDGAAQGVDRERGGLVLDLYQRQQTVMFRLERFLFDQCQAVLDGGIDLAGRDKRPDGIVELRGGQGVEVLRDRVVDVACSLALTGKRWCLRRPHVRTQQSELSRRKNIVVSLAVGPTLFIVEPWALLLAVFAVRLVLARGGVLGGCCTGCRRRRAITSARLDAGGILSTRRRPRCLGVLARPGGVCRLPVSAHWFQLGCGLPQRRREHDLCGRVCVSPSRERREQLPDLAATLTREVDPRTVNEHAFQVVVGAVDALDLTRDEKTTRSEARSQPAARSPSEVVSQIHQHIAAQDEVEASIRKRTQILVERHVVVAEAHQRAQRWMQHQLFALLRRAREVLALDVIRRLSERPRTVVRSTGSLERIGVDVGRDDSDVSLGDVGRELAQHDGERVGLFPACAPRAPDRYGAALRALQKLREHDPPEQVHVVRVPEEIGLADRDPADESDPDPCPRRGAVQLGGERTQSPQPQLARRSPRLANHERVEVLRELVTDPFAQEAPHLLDSGTVIARW